MTKKFPKNKNRAAGEMAQRLRAPNAPVPEDPGSSPVWLSAINTAIDQSIAIKNRKKKQKRNISIPLI